MYDKNIKQLCILMSMIISQAREYVGKDIAINEQQTKCINNVIDAAEQIEAELLQKIGSVSDYDVRRANYNIDRQIIKLSSSSESYAIPKEDFENLTPLFLAAMKLEEVVENQKLGQHFDKVNSFTLI